jgi:hypothetical protein
MTAELIKATPKETQIGKLDDHPSQKIEKMEKDGILTRVFQFDWHTHSDGPMLHTKLFVAPTQIVDKDKEMESFIGQFPEVNQIKISPQLDSQDTIWLPQVSYFIHIATLESKLFFKQFSDYDSTVEALLVDIPHSLLRPQQVKIYHDYDVIIFPTPQLAQAVASVHSKNAKGIHISLYDPTREAQDISMYTDREQYNFEAFMPRELWPKKISTS